MEMRTVFNSPVLTHTKEPNAEGELLSETLKEELGLFGNKIRDGQTTQAREKPSSSRTITETLPMRFSTL